MLTYACTRDLLAAATKVGLSNRSARMVAVSHDLEAIAEEAEARTRDRIAEEAADWKADAVGQVDELLDILRSGAHQLTAKAVIADVDKLIRLKAFLLGEADSRAEVKHSGSIIAEVGDDPEAVKLLADLAGRLAPRPTKPGDASA